MVAKINRGASLYGAIIYNQQKVDEATARIIAGNRMITNSIYDPDRIVRQTMFAFEGYLAANRNTEKPVLHISLNPTLDDNLTDSQFAELARAYMQKMGYGNQPYIVYLHEDIDRRHIHIVSTCVNENGEKIDDAYEWNRSMKACRELEQIFGLKQIVDKRRELLEPYLKKADYTRGDVKQQVSNILKSVFTSYRFQSFGEYSALLACYNIEAKQVKGEFDGKPYSGIIYTMTDDNGSLYVRLSSPRLSASVSAMRVSRNESPTMLRSSERKGGNPKSAMMWLWLCTAPVATVRSSCVRSAARALMSCSERTMPVVSTV